MTTAPPDTSMHSGGGLADADDSRVYRVLRAQGAQITLVLAALVIAFSVAAPDTFAQLYNFRLIIQNAAILAVVSVGMTFVITTSGIDLSAGSVLVFSGVTSAMVMRELGGEGWVVSMIGIAVAVLSGLAWGVLNGVLVAYAKIPALIVTLGTMGMALGTALILCGGVDIREVPPELARHIAYGNVVGQVPTLSVIALVVCIAGAVTLKFTRFGRYVVAIGSNDVAARRVGVNVNLELVKVYALSGVLAGCAGILSLSFFGTTAIGGQTTTVLNVIAAVVIGGTSLFGGVGTVFGTIVGLFIPAVLQNGFVITGVQPFWQQVAVGAVLIAAVYVDQARRTSATRGGSQFPRGILGRAKSRRDAATTGR